MKPQRPTSKDQGAEESASEIVLVVGPSGSGKRTALAILEDRFGYVSVTKVEPDNLKRLFSALPKNRLAVSVSVGLPGRGPFDQESREYLDNCVDAFHALRTDYPNLRILFLYRVQSELRQVETTFYHPLRTVCGSLKAAVFKECELMVQLFHRLAEGHDSVGFAKHLLFIDTSQLRPIDLRDTLEEHFDPSRHAHSARIPPNIITHGWNRMGVALEQVRKTIEFIRREADPKRDAAGRPLNCLILGESGCGKELIAKWLHEEAHALPHAQPGQPDPPFVRVDCAALSPSLIESELFGHVKGSFTGADLERRGLLSEAAGGTVFLDEIGLIDTTTQAKLLTFIEMGRYRMVGGNRWQDVRGCRIFAATSRDLDLEVKQGTFLKDLYYRLAGTTIRVPSLRERREDIPLLLEKLGAPGAPLLGRQGLRRLSAEALAVLVDHDWPGNVRELRQIAERCSHVKGRIEVEDLPTRLTGVYDGLKDYREHVRSTRGVSGDVSAASVSTATRESGPKFLAELVNHVRAGDLSELTENAERSVLLEVLTRHNWDKAKSASELQIARATLYNRIKRFGLKRPRPS